MDVAMGVGGGAKRRLHLAFVGVEICNRTNPQGLSSELGLCLPSPQFSMKQKWGPEQRQGEQPNLLYVYHAPLRSRGPGLRFTLSWGDLVQGLVPQPGLLSCGCGVMLHNDVPGVRDASG